MRKKWAIYLHWRMLSKYEKVLKGGGGGGAWEAGIYKTLGKLREL